MPVKFAMSYSCGKDSTLALHRMAAGHTPVCLVVMVDRSSERSYFHGADSALLAQYEDALGLPMVLCPSNGSDYHLAFEEGLRRAKALGAEGAAFGDIDIADNRRWEEERCAAAGLTAHFPLWQRSRAENVQDLLDLGYRCIIKSVDPDLLPTSLLGRVLDHGAINVMARAGVDICGENGEYHTLAVDGPLFRHPLAYELGEVLPLPHHTVIQVRALPKKGEPT